MTSNLSAFPFIANGSEATPELWNRIFSQLSSNLAAVDSSVSGFSGDTLIASSGTFSLTSNLSIGRDLWVKGNVLVGQPASVVTRTALTLGVRSDTSDYIHFTDTSGAKSSYILGSRVGGTADGLNLWDQSGSTMIASFSKQSIRFYQNVVGPVFDIGGALADTLNAATFGTGADSRESRIQAAISAATAAGVARVYVPANMYPYSAGSISFDTTVQMVREGGNWSVFDVQAYGAYADNVHDDAAAWRASISAATWTSGNVFVPQSAQSYKIGSTLTLGPNMAIGSEGGYKPTIGFSAASGHLFSFLGTAEAQPLNVRIHNMTLLGPGDGVAIRARNFQNLYLDSMDISSWSLGVWTDWGIGTNIDKCNISGNKRGVFLGGPGLAGGIRSTNSQFMDQMLIQGTTFSSNKYDLVDHGTDYSLGGLAVYGCTFYESAGAPVSGKSEFVHLSNRKAIQVAGCWFESPQVNRAGIVFTHVDSDGSNTTMCHGAHVAANDFLFTGASGTNGIIVERASGVVITGNVFEFPVSTGTPVLLSEATHASTVLGNTYLTWADVVGYANPIRSTNSVHQIVEKSNITSSIGTTIFQGVISVVTGIANAPALTHGSNRSIGWYMPAAGTVNWTGVGMGINKTAGLGATLHVGGTALFDSNTQVVGISMASTFSTMANAGVDLLVIHTGAMRTNTVSSAYNLDLGFINIRDGQAGTTAGLRNQAGTAAAPSYAFASETTLGLYRSGVDTIAQSQGTMNLATNAVRLSMRTLAASSLTATAANTNVAVNEVVFTVGGASGASFAINSGGTTYIFYSDTSAKNT